MNKKLQAINEDLVKKTLEDLNNIYASGLYGITAIYL